MLCLVTRKKQFPVRFHLPVSCLTATVLTFARRGTTLIALAAELVAAAETIWL
jgi:hypothetical protein